MTRPAPSFLPRSSFLPPAWVLAVLLCTAGGYAPLAHAERDAAVDQAAADLRANDAPAAFALLDPLEAQRAGDVDYDLALGVAANQTGHYTRAIIALERVVKNDPHNVRAKTELATSYFAVRDTAKAKQLLVEAKAEGVPTEVAGTIDQFMREIDRIDITRPPSKFNHFGYVSFGLGYDNNASSGPNDKLIPVPFLGTTLWMSPSVQAQKSAYYTLNRGYSGRYTLTPEWSWVGSVDYGLNNNTRAVAKPFDVQSLTLATGPMWRKERNELSLLVSYSQQEQGGSRAAQANGLVGSWIYRLDGFRQWSTYIQYNRNQYDNNSYANANRTIVGSTYSQMWRNGGVFAFGGLYAGKEKPASGDPLLQHLGNSIYGLRTGDRKSVV